MTDDNKYLIAGGFSLVAIVGFIVMMLLLADDSSTETTRPFIVPFEQSVNGLAIGAPVTYLGVRVGTVTAIKLASQSNREVDVFLEVAESTPVSTATYATLSMQGITGVAFIGLTADPDMPPRALSPTALIDGVPVIPARPGNFESLISSSGEISDQLTVALNRLNRILTADNIDAISRTLANLADVSDDIAARSEAFADLPQQLAMTLDEVSTTASALRDVIDASSSRVPTILASLEQVTDDLAAISARLNTATGDSEPELRAFLGGGLGQTPALIAETRAALRELQKLVQDIREDPSQLIYKPSTDDLEVGP
ncbi:MAG: MlaD family protein [Pseudomonadota bacterium]